MSEVLMKALFAQQRAQIIQMRASGTGVIDDAYAYAWVGGLYPVNHDSDYSVPDRPHENFRDYFLVTDDFANDVIKYLDDRWLDKKCPTFYELEDHYGGRDKRSDLVKVCRYCYLGGAFDKVLWDALRTPTEHPAEATGINREFSDSDLYVC